MYRLTHRIAALMSACVPLPNVRKQRKMVPSGLSCRIISMKHCFFTLLIVLLCGLSLNGCKPRNQNETASTFGGAASVQFGDARLQKEDFDRSLELINNLADSPSLPDSPGFEQLVGIADRLDKWIHNQKPDDTWKSHAEFQNVERAAMNAADTAKKVVRSLALLQGEIVLDDDGQPIIASATLQEERQAVTVGLEQFVTQIQTLGTLAQLPTMSRYAQHVSDLQKRFAALENIPNLNAGAIRAFAKQLEKEANDFAVSAFMFEDYARQLKTDGLFISTSDVDYLKQSAWMRGLSQWTCGDKRVLLDQAVQMCDWVVCNIEMRNNWIPLNEQRAIEVLPQHPWQTILLGYGTAPDRTAIFLELLRQRRIDAALLALPHPNDPKVPIYWGVGVLLDGEVYVFQLEYGFPIPHAEGVKAGDDGSLQFSGVATLSQLMQDDSLLRRLDFSDEQQFPVTAEMLQQTTAHLFLPPESVSMRMKVLEAELSGEQNMILYTDPAELSRRFQNASGISGVEIWKYPFRTAFEQRFSPEDTNEALNIFLVQRPRLNLDDSAVQKHYPLWSGRVLYFKGAISGQENAITKYQNTRVSDKEMIAYRDDPSFRNNPVFGMQLQWVSTQASYWLGAALFEVDSIEAAKDCLMGIRTNRLNDWRNQTEYLLGRIAEREKRYDDARRHYANTAKTLSGPGNALRSRWLPKPE
ncbi:MAG: hypothetical protein LBI05_06255 [Planctomycetaceae bacterium]|jgi:hypothetical protein|nr:hypothetical protein [Planctomycetaceae bacterium]